MTSRLRKHRAAAAENVNESVDIFWKQRHYLSEQLVLVARVVYWAFDIIAHILKQ